MPEPTECLRCRGPMERGFVLDRGHMDSLDLQKWVEGSPERSWWRGIKTHGKESYKVQTFRCERCGLLEEYANEE
jgi:hypothetical protein